MLDFSSKVIAWVERSVGPGTRVVRVMQLSSGATPTHLLELEAADGSIERCVLTFYPDPNPDSRAHTPAYEEFALLLCLMHQIPAPQVIAVDREGISLEVPALLETCIPGQPGWNVGNLGDYLQQAANILVN